jgi:peptidoglycan-associated lipoprotein
MFEKSSSENEPELKGYFSSNRVGSKWRSKGNTDIYYFDKQQIFFNLDGQVIDVADGSPLSGVTVELIGPSSSKVATTDGFGNFSFDELNFKEEEDYRLVVNKEWFFQQVDTTITTKNIPKKECTYIEDGNRQGNLMLNMTRDFQMKTMRRPLVLKSVLFDLGKSDLRIEGKAELDSLASLLTKDWPNVVIELRSHTDLRGSDILNEKLSLARAQSCVDYLVDQGVASERLIAKGMAANEPVVIDVVIKGLPKGTIDLAYINKLPSKRLREKAHQKNRRTDFKVLSNDLKSWVKDNPISDELPFIKDATIDKDGNIKPNIQGEFIGEY